MPRLRQQDGGDAVLQGTLQRTERVDGAMAVLALPETGRMITFKENNGQLYAVTGTAALPLQSVLHLAARQAGRDLRVELYAG
ncbi:hypothetical protein [Xylophilus sp. GOD-11R]|uniref:hypothetical protein n=1 Tax=Xylophilus sp. GOD-11R TaxID=3089814 RepID=UPI00298C7360|nr:hypothetical protein [Xylophilus sp. GOD-11R]WPB56222.1 hypothetical protein R9X41_19065 [Xylophilus sp. GOD-11R]